MGSLGFWRLAQTEPRWVAAVDPDGTEHTAAHVVARVNQLTHALRERGLRPGDGIASLLPNGVCALEVYLAALGGGWYFTPINWHYTGPEIGYILHDSEAKAFFADSRYSAQAVKAADEAQLERAARFSCGEIPGFLPVSELRRGQPGCLPSGRTAGATMHYTSGTTGRPKGVRRELSGLDPDDLGELMSLLLQMFGVTTGQPNVHLVTSPNYHTAVTQFGGTALHMGHTIVYMDNWDPVAALEKIERYRVTSSHMVPTHFKRLLALPEHVRKRYDLSSMKWLIHAAAPCPVPVKRAMLDWWGPCIYEYYAATEGGGTIATPQDWLAHPGTVGKPWPVSEIRIVGDDGRDCRPGIPGTIYLKMAVSSFVYKGDPEKTAANRLDGFFTVGDVGFVDDEGFLYLCDRKADRII
jgi:long-chain acyl-CoA synthetase